MRDYAFYKLDDGQPRRGFAVVPARRLLRRLLRPMLIRQEALLRDLGESVDRLAACCADLERRQQELRGRQDELVHRHEDLARRWAETNHFAVHLQDVWAENNHELVTDNKELRKEMAEAILRMEEDTSAIAAIGWDHVAVTRRLAAIEDSLGDD